MTAGGRGDRPQSPSSTIGPKLLPYLRNPRNPRLALPAEPVGRLLASPLAITSAHDAFRRVGSPARDDCGLRSVHPNRDPALRNDARAVQLELLARCLPSDGRVIDLGGGTGALARAVAEKFPAVRVEIWDTDPAMLEVARERCARFGGRVHFVERSFAEPLPACDAVVACIALHHVLRTWRLRGRSMLTSVRRCAPEEFSPTPIAS